MQIAARHGGKGEADEQEGDDDGRMRQQTGGRSQEIAHVARSRPEKAASGMSDPLPGAMQQSPAMEHEAWR